MLFKVAVVVLSILFSSLALAESVWIDVRSAVEHKLDNIDGDIRISHSEIVDGVASRYPDKETQIHLYCRSGRRAEKAMSDLIAAGYSNVVNAGGINDARKLRDLIEMGDVQE